MIKWFKKNRDQVERNDQIESNDAHIEPITAEIESESSMAKPSFYQRFKQSLSKTRDQLNEGISRLFLGKKMLDAALVEHIENLLIQADIGLSVTQTLIDELQAMMTRKELVDGERVLQILEQQLQKLLQPLAQPLVLPQNFSTPFVILMIGVNGAGKTTTIGKLARQFQQQGKKVMLAAGDTFRAAAVEQLQKWGERNQIPVIAQHTGADSASVIFDALTAAKSRGIDVVIADTAGRLHTQSNLMEELKKIKRVMQKIDPAMPHETMLILDAGIGQNALNQAREFHQAIGITGITMTKLDGTAKGGILFAIADALHLPFRYMGFGEAIDDLRPFDASLLVRAIFHDDSV